MGLDYTQFDELAFDFNSLKEIPTSGVYQLAEVVDPLWDIIGEWKGTKDFTQFNNALTYLYHRRQPVLFFI